MKYVVFTILSVISIDLFADNRVLVVDCMTLSGYARENGKSVPVETSIKNVLGSEPLQFYSAPSQYCVEDSGPIEMKHELTAMRIYNEFTMVVVRIPESGVELEKWAYTKRLKQGNLIDTNPTYYKGEPYPIE